MPGMTMSMKIRSGLISPREAHALGAVSGRGRAVAVLLERLLHHVHFGGRVVDDQYQRHSVYLPICVSMALRSSSLVNGLVR